ncbi:MAG: DUF664 domain-containing protein, partial [Chloroflexi bacterium]|nr:DUF664 domain-containing protein [Chloroflexota bacterium]
LNMVAEVQGYLTELGLLRKQVHTAVQGLNDEAANWHPLPEGTNSIYGIISHLIGGESYWVRQVIAGETLQRDREAELHATGSLSELLERWDKAGKDSAAILGNLTLKELGETRSPSIHRPEWGDITVRWCILHVISHLSLHVGHIQLTRQLWEQRPS